MKANLTDAVQEVLPAADKQKFLLLGIISGVLFLIGTALNSIAYSSIDPVFASLFFLLLGHVVLLIPQAGGQYERLAYQLIFSIGWFWSGLTAIFDNFISHQVFSDAIVFYDLATNSADLHGLSFGDTITALGENGGATVLWLKAYELFSFFGIEPNRYIGAAVNVTFIALTAVVGLKMVKTIFGYDRARFFRFILIFAFCGDFWLFAAIHIRDAMVLFAVSLLTYFWVRFLTFQSVANLFGLGLATAFGFFSFGSLRVELVYVPLAMMAAGLGAIICAQKQPSQLIKWIPFVLLCGCVGYYVALTMMNDLSSDIVIDHEGYSELSLAESQESSLGVKLIIDQSFLLRLPYGSAYLFLYPIPFWSGFQLQSSYQIFKSFNALFMYALTPLFALAVWRVILLKNLRRASVLFLLFFVIGSALSIAYSSMETRHFAASFVSIMVVALVPDLSRFLEKRAYWRMLALYFGLIASVYVAWILLKSGGAT